MNQKQLKNVASIAVNTLKELSWKERVLVALATYSVVRAVRNVVKQ